MCMCLLLCVQYLLNTDAPQTIPDIQTDLRPAGFRMWVKGFAEVLISFTTCLSSNLELLGKGCFLLTS